MRSWIREAVMAAFVVTTSVNLAGFWPHSELVASPRQSQKDTQGTDFRASEPP